MKKDDRTQPKRKRFLRRSIITIALALGIPFLVFSFFTIRQSYLHMLETSRGNYIDTATQYANSIDEFFSGLITRSLQIGMERKLIQKHIEENPYYMMEASEQIMNYKIGTSVDDLAIRFYRTDYVITSLFQYSNADFAQKYCGSDPNLQSRFSSFLTDETSGGLIRCFSTYGMLPADQSDSERLFLSVPIYMNTGSKKDAAILYILNTETFSSLTRPFTQGDGAGILLVSGRGDQVYAFGDPKLRVSSGAMAQAVSVADKPTELAVDGTVYELFPARMDCGDMACVLAIPKETTLLGASALFHVLVLSMAICAVALLVLLAFTVYVNYRPIYRLMKRFPNAEGEDASQHELQYIENVIDQLSLQKKDLQGEINEYKRTLTEHTLLEKMLYGSESGQQTLLDDWRGKCVRVACIYGARLSGINRNYLVEEMRKLFQADLFLLDVPHEAFKTAVCFYARGTRTEIFQASFADHLSQMGIQAAWGDEKNDINAVNDSYAEARLAMHKNIYGMPYDAFPVVFDSQSELNRHAMALLNAISRQDFPSAHRSLKQYMAIISSGLIQDPKIETYLMNLLANSVFQEAEKLGIAVPGPNAVRLAAAHTPLIFETEMAQMLDFLDASIQTMSREKEAKFETDLISYVNQHCFQPEITLLSAADHFDLSIYTLSRSFKEITGIGFREYITARRLDQARHLLITTNKSINDIAVEVGFSGADYFTRLFKLRDQVTPSDYRSKYQMNA